VIEVLDDRGRSGEEEGGVAVVLPPDKIRRLAVSASDLDDLAIPVWFAGAFATNE